MGALTDLGGNYPEYELNELKTFSPPGEQQNPRSSSGSSDSRIFNQDDPSWRDQQQWSYPSASSPAQFIPVSEINRLAPAEAIEKARRKFQWKQATWLPQSLDRWLIKNHLKVIEVPPTNASFKFRAQRLVKEFKSKGIPSLLSEAEINQVAETVAKEQVSLLQQAYNEGSITLLRPKIEASTFQYFAQRVANQNVSKLQETEPIAIKGAVKISQSGINNSGVDCYLNSALQVLKDRFENQTEEQQDQSLKAIRAKSYFRASPPLASFLKGLFDATDSTKALLLRDDVRQLLIAKKVGDPIAKNITTNGKSCRQADASEALLALMEVASMPLLSFQETLADEEPRGVQERILPLNLSSEGSELTIDGLITANLTEQVDHKGAVKEKKRTFADQTAPLEQLTLQLNRFTPPSGRKEDPQKVSRPISGVTQPCTITRNIDLGTAGWPIPTDIITQYTPTSIICHLGESMNSGHYVTYRQKEEKWYLINDDKVEEINLNDAPQPSFGKIPDAGNSNGGEKEMTHQEFIERNAYVINYRNIAPPCLSLIKKSEEIIEHNRAPTTENSRATSININSGPSDDDNNEEEKSSNSTTNIPKEINDALTRLPYDQAFRD